MSDDVAENLPVAAGPKLLIGGTFAIYEDGRGGLVLVTDVEGRGEERRAVPAAVIKMMTGHGPVARMMGKMFAGGPG
jgi:hypothetical protein